MDRFEKVLAIILGLFWFITAVMFISYMEKCGFLSALSKYGDNALALSVIITPINLLILEVFFMFFLKDRTKELEDRNRELENRNKELEDRDKEKNNNAMINQISELTSAVTSLSQQLNYQND